MTKRIGLRILLALALLFVSSKTDAGTSGTYGPLSGGGSGTVTSITVANATALGAISAGSLSDGAVAFVQTLKASFILEASTATAVPLVNVAASGDAGHQWVRQLVRSPVWEVRTTWTIDPTNTTGLASDENDGVDATVPLLTYQEHARRLTEAKISQGVAVAVLGTQQAGDLPAYTYRTSNFATVAFTGTPVVVQTGTVTSFTAMTYGSVALDDAELVDNSVAGGSWTAAGALAKGVLLKRTNGTVIYWYALKDLGTKTLRCSQPIDTAHTLNRPALAGGDTYQILQLPKIVSMRVADPALVGTQFAQFEMAYSGFFYNGHWLKNCYVTTNPSEVGGLWYNVCIDSGSGTYNPDNVGLNISGGCFKGTGATVYSFVGVILNTEANIITLQGCGLLISICGYAAQQVNVYDTSAPALRTDIGARIQLLGVVNGSGNSGTIVQAQSGTQIVWTPATLFNGGITSNANPYQAGATGSASPILLTAQGNGVFQTQ